MVTVNNCVGSVISKLHLKVVMRHMRAGQKSKELLWRTSVCASYLGALQPGAELRAQLVAQKIQVHADKWNALINFPLFHFAWFNRSARSTTEPVWNSAVLQLYRAKQPKLLSTQTLQIQRHSQETNSLFRPETYVYFDFPTPDNKQPPSRNPHSHLRLGGSFQQTKAPPSGASAARHSPPAASSRPSASRDGAAITARASRHAPRCSQRPHPVYQQAAITAAAPAGSPQPRCKGGTGKCHSLRGDVEADISVLPQHVQHGAHSCPLLRFPPARPRAALATGALPQRSGLAAALERAVPVLPPRPAPSPVRCHRRCPGAFWRERRVWALCEGRQGASGRWVRLFLVP